MENSLNTFGLTLICVVLFLLFLYCLCIFTSPASAERILRMQNETSDNHDAVVVDVVGPTELEIIQLEIQDVESSLSTIEHLKGVLRNLEERLDRIG